MYLSEVLITVGNQLEDKEDERLPYNIYHPRLAAVLYTCCMHLCIQHSPTMYLSIFRERNHEDGDEDELVFTPSAAANSSGNVLGQLDFLPNLKDRMHDSAMSVNATTSIDSPCRRLVGSSTSRSRFRTQAHHLRQALVRYPFIHSEEIDLRLSPTETQLPPCGPDAESGTTWVHTTVGVYAPVRLHIVPPPSSLFKFI